MNRLLGGRDIELDAVNRGNQCDVPARRGSNLQARVHSLVIEVLIPCQFRYVLVDQARVRLVDQAHVMGRVDRHTGQPLQKYGTRTSRLHGSFGRTRDVISVGQTKIGGIWPEDKAVIHELHRDLVDRGQANRERCFGLLFGEAAHVEIVDVGPREDLTTIFREGIRGVGEETDDNYGGEEDAIRNRSPGSFFVLEMSLGFPMPKLATWRAVAHDFGPPHMLGYRLSQLSSHATIKPSILVRQHAIIQRVEDLTVRFKYFSGAGADLEREINGWLEEFEPDVTQVVQTVAPDGALTIGFLFEESFRGQEKRFTLEHGIARDAAIPPATMADRPVTVPIEPGTPLTERTS